MIPKGQAVVYHTHGIRQGMGTCKLHRYPECVHIKYWRPGAGMAKVVMREMVDINASADQFCKTCWG